MPPTIVTRSLADVQAFRAEMKDIILKPLYGNGGAAIFRIAPGDTNVGSLVELFCAFGAQSFHSNPTGRTTICRLQVSPWSVSGKRPWTGRRL